jgi:hypothetical protein
MGSTHHKCIAGNCPAKEREDPMYYRATFLLSLLVASAMSLSAESFSYTGTLGSAEGVFQTTFTLNGPDTITFQTWSFGGGTNAAGQAIPAGGFDPLISLFNGPGSSATIYVDGSSNPLADSDSLLNPPWSYIGNCPPAGTVAIGTNNDCGDDFMQVALAAGTYTLVLTDANYIPEAVFDNGALSEGFNDLTGGAFQTCDPVDNACITPNGNYALDIISPDSQIASPVPEPPAFSLLCIGLGLLAAAKLLHNRHMTPPTKGVAR